MKESGYERPLSTSYFLLILALCLLGLAAVQGQTPGNKQTQPAPREEQVNPEEPSEDPTPELAEEIVVVGTRSQPRTITESVVPIDVISSNDMAGQGDTDIADQLRTVLPSYNVNPQPVGDAARIVRPASLRGLAPDHTLVLVNGKRRHRSAIITWLGAGLQTAPRDRISRLSRQSRYGRSRCCGMGPRPSMAQTPSLAC